MKKKKWLLLGGVSLSLVLLAVCSYAGQIPGASQLAGFARPALRPVLGFDDSPDPDTASRPQLGFDDGTHQLLLPAVAVSPDTTAPPATPATTSVPQALPSPAACACVAPRPACSSCPSCACAPCAGEANHPRLWFEGDFLLWWIKDSRLPPLVTTSPPASLGVLGQPGTAVLFGGNLDNEDRLGGRFRAGLWLDDCRSFGVETGFFFLGQRSNDFLAGSGGSPLLARPFFNAFAGAQDAEQVANPAVPSLPLLLPLTGRVGVNSTSRFWGLEANGTHQLWADCTSRVSVLAGFRYLRLDEGVGIDEDLLVPADALEAAGTRFQLDDNFSTHNNFYGGQVGGKGEWVRGRWSLDVLGKVALGVSQQRADVRGATLVTAPGAAPEAFTGALLALPTNIGRYDRDQFAVVPEADVNLGYRVTERLRVRVGYTFLYWSSVARPGDQINLAVNSTQIPPGTLRGAAQPAFGFKGTDFWAQGLNFGVQYEY
jgi:hypothetical protein